MSQLGMGALIQMLGGNEDAYNAYQSSLNKKIVSVKLDDDLNDRDGALILSFTDGTELMLYDCARSCCESRWMHTDDDLGYYKNCTFKGIEINQGDVKEGEWDTEEVTFLHVKTTKGTIVVNTYNSHNGYYGGIIISATITSCG